MLKYGNSFALSSNSFILWPINALRKIKYYILLHSLCDIYRDVTTRFDNVYIIANIKITRQLTLYLSPQ